MGRGIVAQWTNKITGKELDRSEGYKDANG
jgi:hypothetical protein